MRSNWSAKLGLLTVFVLAAVLAASPTDPGKEPRSGTTGLDAWQRGEVARIRDHLAGAERLLLSVDVSSLTPAQQAARAHNIELLRDYREHGAFPRNIHFADAREPYFVDDRGVLCAMAYLIAQSGRRDIVERVRSTRNNARIRELADDPVLVAWLKEAGLTVAEAARVQPAYGGPTDALSPVYAAASAGFTIVNAAGLIWNARRGQAARSTGFLALAGGTGGVLLGASGIGDGPATTLLGVWNIALGTVTALAGAQTLWAGVPSQPAAASRSGKSSAVSSRAPKHGQVTIAPTIGARAGLRLNVTF